MSCPNPLHSPGVAVDAREEKSRKLSGIFNVFGKFAIDVGEDLSARARKRLPQAQKTADLGRRSRTRHADGAAPVSQDKEDATAYWKHLDRQKAYTTGMQAAHLPCSGKYKWIDTCMYWGIEHEVMPADMALSCVQCHESLKGERTCNRCH